MESTVQYSTMNALFYILKSSPFDNYVLHHHHHLPSHVSHASVGEIKQFGFVYLAEIVFIFMFA